MAYCIVAPTLLFSIRQCVNVAPSSFLMLETGRARTFNQQSGPDVDQAVASCPVNCMHPVSFRELKEFETARDEGDGRTDHRHLGKGHIPLYVAGIDSDMNRRSSWYHTLKHRCLGTYFCEADDPNFSSLPNVAFKQFRRNVPRKDAMYVPNFRIQVITPILKRVIARPNMQERLISRKAAMLMCGSRVKIYSF